MTKFEVFLATLFNNPLGRWYLGVPKGKKIYKITRSSAHYYTGDFAQDGRPVICTGEAFPSGIRLFNKFAFAGKFLGLISVFALTKFVVVHGMLPLFALSDTGAKFPGSNASAGGTQYTNPANVYSDNGVYATGSYQNNQYYYNFGFGVTAGATINGYEIKVEGHYSSGGTRVSFYDPMELFVGQSGDDRGSIGSQTNLNVDTDTVVTFGGATTLPSTPLTVTEINDNTSAGINVRLQTSNTGGSGVSATSIDYLTVKIYYTAIALPTVTTQAVSSIGTTTATGNGNITATGGENNDIRGVVYDTATHGAPGNVAPASSGYASKVEETGGSFSTGAFTEAITGLSQATTYYVRAYSHNSSGYSYGAEVSFTTGQTLTKTVSAKARLKVLGNDKTVSAKARIKLLGNNKTVSAKARIKQADLTKTISAKAKILVVGTKTISAKADIFNTVTRTVSAKARIKTMAVTKTISTLARIKQINVTVTVSSKARIKVINITKTISAKARIFAWPIGVILGLNRDTGLGIGVRNHVMMGLNKDTGVGVGTRLRH